MKKIIPLILIFSMAFSACNYNNKFSDQNNEEVKFRKSIWITYYELSDFTKGNDELSFRKIIKDCFVNLSRLGFNTVTVQVRPCGDAFYKSKFYPTSIYFNGMQGSELFYDPLKIICEIGEKLNLNIEAWINPYRVSQDNNYSNLSSDNFALLHRGMTEVVDDKIYYNPAYNEVRALIVNGVKEIVEGYNISAIHFDDYFYPTTNKTFDKDEYLNYKGKLTLYEWRRENVNMLIREVYAAIKGINNDVEFGISPAASINSNFNNLYADIPKWISEKGYIDYICPQVYFGFENENQPFMSTVKEWAKLLENSNVQLFIGLPLYKANSLDKYASNNTYAQREFLNNDDIIYRQINYITKIDIIKGYYIFSYSQLSDDKCKNEVSNMIVAMQSSSQN